MPPCDAVPVSVISTGEELVTGHTVDTNASFLASELTAHGFQVRLLLALGDDVDAVERELRRAAGDCTFVLVTGGLGPTADDRTRVAVARAAGAELVPDEESLEHVRRIIRGYGREVTEAQAAQARFPDGAEVFPNELGTARGFACRLGRATVVAMPGVPDEMRAMFKGAVLPFLLRHSGQAAVVVRTVNLFGVPESQVDAAIGDMMAPGRNPSVGLKVQGGGVYVCLRARAGTQQRAQRLARADVERLIETFGDAAFGCDETSLALALSRLLESQGLRIGIAESCTGGMVGSLLTGVPGISRFFLVDVVAYSDESKTRELGVPTEEIRSHGAVSREVAESMARGVCEASGAELGISTTGIAGPGGGSAEKPVGLVHVGVCLEGRTRAHELRLRGDRKRVIDRASRHALNFARLALLERRRRGADTVR